jgi:hypothetical protein
VPLVAQLAAEDAGSEATGGPTELQASNQEIAAHPGLNPADSAAITHDHAWAVFGQVMGFVALTLGSLPSAHTSAGT